MAIIRTIPAVKEESLISELLKRTQQSVVKKMLDNRKKRKLTKTA